MAGPARLEAPSLIAQLAERPFGYDFFRAVRLLEACNAALPRVGCSQRLRDDFVRFGQNPSLAFAPSTLQGIDAGNADRPARLLVNFMGLFGPHGPLPLHITEFAHERQLNAKDQTMARFMDVFHHRMMSLFYRAWASSQKTVDFDRPDDSRFATYIGSLFGIGLESLRNRDEVPDVAKLFFSGRLVCQARNSEGLRAILEDFFGIRTRIEDFFGHWLEVPPASRCRLGESPLTGSLGQTALVGARMYNAQLKFRIRMGPMGFADLQRMLPLGGSFRRLKCWVLNYVGREFSWDVQLVLKAAEVPDTSLGKAGMLGWTTWLKSKPFERDAEDVVINGD